MQEDSSTNQTGEGQHKPRFETYLRLQIVAQIRPRMAEYDIPIEDARDAAEQVLLYISSVNTLLMMLSGYRLQLYGGENLASLFLTLGELYSSLLSEALYQIERLDDARQEKDGGEGDKQ